MKANFGIMPPLESKQRMNKRQRAAMYSERSLQKLESFLSGAEK
jgi:folate-dependent tRNA-U54 methylase TrmFO/GidA